MSRDLPLKSLSELDGWMAATSSTRPASLIQRPTSSAPEIILCHDLRGGYSDDAVVQGNKNCSAYRFFHFHMIDIFIYFSHHLVTIPPVSWIDCCHRNGVRCYGTLITEWEAGVDICSQMFATEESAKKYAALLSGIADHYMFDGWLINIENKLEETLIPNLIVFLDSLKQPCIWYDSVTVKGDLKWQDEVNEHNIDFLRASGSIFLNYCWTEENLKQTVARLCNDESIKHCRVFVGVDCFGRGCLGGGGFNTDVALKVIRQFDQLNVALFAPGWVFETYEQSDDLFERYLEFFEKLESYVGSPRPFCGRLNTTFCLGQGEHWYRQGRLVSNEPWNCLREMHLMPHYWDSGDDSVYLMRCQSRGYLNSGCLCLSIQGPLIRTFPLFDLLIPAKQAKSFKLVYSLDDQFENRPLDPVVVFLVICATSPDITGDIICICHPMLSQSDTLLLENVREHYSNDQSKCVVFPMTACTEVNGDCSWHVTLTKPTNPTLAFSSSQSESTGIHSNETFGEDCVLRQISIVVIPPKLHSLNIPLNVYIGQIKISLLS